jgi:flagellar FliL protein
MAEEKTETDVDTQSKQSGGGNKLIIILVVLVLFMMIGMGALAFLFMSSSKQPAVAVDGEASEELGEEVPLEPEIYTPLSPAFIINVQHQGRQRHIQISTAVMARDQSIIDAVVTHMPVIRNDLVIMFKDQAYEDFSTTDGVKAVRKKALEIVQSIIEEKMGVEGPEDLYFTNIVMQ